MFVKNELPEGGARGPDPFSAPPNYRISDYVIGFFAVLLCFTIVGIPLGYWLSKSITPIDRDDADSTTKMVMSLVVDEFEVLENPGEGGNEGDERIQKKLLGNDRLSGDIVHKYAEHLNAHNDFVFVENALYPGGLTQNFAQTVEEKVNEGNKLVFIPLILEKGNDHIVLLAYNPTESQFEYYDSQGKDPNSEQRTIKGTKLTPKKLLDKIGKNKKVVYNKIGQQGFFDHTNCGVYVSEFMKARAQSGSFDEARDSLQGLDPKAKRIEMAAAL